MKNAIVIGATGLVGRQLVDQLLNNNTVETVRVFSRRSIGIDHPKLLEFETDFHQLDEHAKNFTGDVLFSVLGTTLKTAGSKEAQYAIDFDMQYNAAKIARSNQVKQLVLLSSAGADSKSRFFYSQMKGQLDDAVKALNFEKTAIIRPSMLTGNRKEFRWSEKLFTPVMHLFSWVPGIRKYRPINVEVVEKAIINSVNQKINFSIYELECVFKLAKK